MNLNIFIFLALVDWQKASRYYENVLSDNSIATSEQLVTAKLGYCKCLLQLHHYSRVLDRLNSARIETADLWLIFAQAQRHMGLYNGARWSIQKAVQRDPNNKIIRREQEAIELSKERKSLSEQPVFNARIATLDEQKPWINILSIDGGGIRGLVPAIWLMELERRLHQPISSIFHVVAGTSTGAMIAAGLSTHHLEQRNKPRYQAHDLVQLYRTKADKVFSRSSSYWSRLGNIFFQEAKYLDVGRQTLFGEYFGRSKLSDSLTEVVIPAVKAEGNITDVFTRSKGARDESENFYLKDALMCTTAAPTYFPHYPFNDTAYVDGGVQANNPAMIAYTHALGLYRPTHRTHVRILSLGTGDYVADPLNPAVSRNLLFWHRNRRSVFKTLMDGPQNNSDIHINDILDENYYRWQIWLEKPIELDDIKETTMERPIDLAYAKLEEMEAYDDRS